MDDQQLNKIKSDYSSFTKTTVLLTLSSSLSEEIALKPFNTREWRASYFFLQYNS